MECISFAVGSRVNGPIRFAGSPHVRFNFVDVLLSEQSAALVKPQYDAVFCPGNSFGHMTGGFDQGVVDVWGQAVEDAVVAMIDEKYFGMMPVGFSEVVVVEGRAFVYTPTMMVPNDQTPPDAPYMHMHSALHALYRHEQATKTTYGRLLVPLYCAGTGASLPYVALRQQTAALVEFFDGLNGESLGCSDLFRDGTRRYRTLTAGQG